MKNLLLPVLAVLIISAPAMAQNFEIRKRLQVKVRKLSTKVMRKTQMNSTTLTIRELRQLKRTLERANNILDGLAPVPGPGPIPTPIPVPVPTLKCAQDLQSNFQAAC